MRRFAFTLLLLTACTKGGKPATVAPSAPVVAASPPKDDGKTVDGPTNNDNHSAALEQLKVGPIINRIDKQSSVVVPLPDGQHWTRVRFLTVKSLVGFRYGKEHHAIFGGFVTYVDDNTVIGACDKSFEQWANPWIEAFEVELKHEAPTAFSWSAPPVPPSTRTVSIIDIDSVHAKVATVIARDSYEAAWAAYPAWGTKACLVMGVAIPVRDDPERARDARDRFVREVLPKIAVTSYTEPKERY